MRLCFATTSLSWLTIHADLVFDGRKHIPFGNTLTGTGCTNDNQPANKSFNIAGLRKLALPSLAQMSCSKSLICRRTVHGAVSQPLRVSHRASRGLNVKTG